MTEFTKNPEFFAAITQNSSELIIIVDEKATITYVNPAVEHVLGYQPDDFIGQNGFDFIASDELPRALVDFDYAVKTKNEVIKNIFRIRHRDGSERILEGVGKNLLDNPAVAGFVMNVRDVTDRWKAENELGVYRQRLECLVEERTAALAHINAQLCREIEERKHMEEALRESREKYRKFMEDAPVGVCIVDAEGKILSVNRIIEKETDWQRAELIGRNGLTAGFFDEDTQSLLSERLKTRFKGGPPERREVPVYCKNGTRLWVDFKTTILEKDGITVGAQVVITDVTERKKAEEERETLRERLYCAEKMEALGTLAGGVAHDLNNVLGALVGYSELLLLKIDEADPLRRYVSRIMSSGERAAAIVQDLLALARRGVNTSEVINLNDIAGNLQKTPEFERLAFFHPQVRIRFDLEADLLHIKGSPVHLEKTIMNLASNAAEAMPDGGILTVATGNVFLDRPLDGYDHVSVGDYVVLSVSDSGDGISPSDLNRIFEPFYTKKVMGRSGTGLGLSVVWGTVKDHQGYINVQSEVKKGSTFTLYFPVTREIISGQAHPRSRSDYAGNKESILVVDDVESQRDLAVQMLTELNYRTVAVASGEEALACLKNERPDLVMLDMIMDPGMDGLDTYRRILDIHPRQKAIIVSGYSETERVREAQALGAGAYLKKPYIMERLGLAVRRELDKPA